MLVLSPFNLCNVMSLHLCLQFVETKYEKQDRKIVKQSERQFELEKEHERMMQRLHGSHQSFSLKPVPTPPGEKRTNDGE